MKPFSGVGVINCYRVPLRTRRRRLMSWPVALAVAAIGAWLVVLALPEAEPIRVIPTTKALR
ncbi:MAG: hypothetical protein AB7O80_10930 [Acetobacteraceae bacterium]